MTKEEWLTIAFYFVCFMNTISWVVIYLEFRKKRVNGK